MNTIVGDGFPIDLNSYPADTPSSPPPSPLFLTPLIVPDFTPRSYPFFLAYDQPPPPLSPAMFLPSLYTPSSSPFVSSPPLLSGPPLPLLLPDTPSSDPFLFSPPLPSGPPPLSPLPVLFQQPAGWNEEEEEWLSYQMQEPLRNTEEERLRTIQASQRPEPRRNGGNAEEERWSSIQRQEPWRDITEYWSNIERQEPEQTTLTEWQIWEALDKLENQVYTGETCAICLEYFVPEETVSITPCKHMFHKECLVPWVMQKGQCPHCRFFLFEATRNRW